MYIATLCPHIPYISRRDPFFPAERIVDDDLAEVTCSPLRRIPACRLNIRYISKCEYSLHTPVTRMHKHRTLLYIFSAFTSARVYHLYDTFYYRHAVEGVGYGHVVPSSSSMESSLLAHLTAFRCTPPRMWRSRFMICDIHLRSLHL